MAWALYQTLLGAAVAAIVPGGSLAAVGVSILVAVAMGFGLDGLPGAAVSQGRARMDA